MYEFSLLWFFIGIAVVLGGIVFMRYYKEIADNMGQGVSSYNHYKIAALVICGAGLLMAFNLHNLVIAFVANLIFGGVVNK